jgi:hypothetical protein
MSTVTKISAALALVASLGACAGRQAIPVTPMQATDNDLACQPLQAEVVNNNAKLLQLDQEKISRQNSNLAVGLVGAVLFPPAVFLLDMGDAPETEAAALQQRNDHLNKLAAQKGCFTKVAQG